ncbi:MAG: hypothetical protein HQ513_13590 [Rhodospirillales bacterium]|nr:hypothetical protein [Rhodospirillales bacterium]
MSISAPAAMSADAISVKAVMVPKESMKMNFNDGSKHFVLLVRREGKAVGEGAFAGADVTEYGWHDINPPIGADPHGYLQFKAANGDIANIKWTVRAVFFKGEKKPRLADYGFWEMVSGTGRFADNTGVGTLTIKAASKTDRLFTLSGEIGQKP